MLKAHGKLDFFFFQIIYFQNTFFFLLSAQNVIPQLGSGEQLSTFVVLDLVSLTQFSDQIAVRDRSYMRSANETLHCNVVSHWLGAYTKLSLRC